MKRYVKEFCNDEIRKLKAAKTGMNADIVEKRIDYITRYMNACKRGLITDHETIKSVIEITEQYFM